MGYFGVLARSLYYSFGLIRTGFVEYAGRMLIRDFFPNVSCVLGNVCSGYGSFGLRTPVCMGCMSVDKIPIYCGAECCRLLKV